MAARKPLVIVSGLFSELPAGDTAFVLAAAPSGLIYVGSSLGIDGSAQISGNAGISAAVTAQASGNAALVVGTRALASGNLGITNAATAQASGNAALVVGATATTNAATALASGNAALVVGANALASGNLGVTNSATALASGNAALAVGSAKYDKTGGPINGPIVVTSQSFGTVKIVASSGVIILPFASGNNFDLTLSSSATMASPTNASGGQSGAIVIRQNNTGSNLLSYSGSWSFQGGTAPTLTTALSGVDVLAYYVVSPTRVVGVLTANYSGGSQ